MTGTTPDAEGHDALPTTCPSCAAPLQNVPGVSTLACPACGTRLEPAAAPAAPVVHHAYAEWARGAAGRTAAELGATILQCQGCHATTVTTEVAGRCAFCASPLVPVSAPEGVLAPTGVVPFALSRTDAHSAFLAWLHAKQVTPDSVAGVNSAESLTSVYVPWWTVTARATTWYDGKRGTAKVVGYKDDDQREEILSWSWVDAAGTVVRDVAGAPASAASLSTEVRRLVAGSDLSSAVPYRPELVTGHAVRRYDVEPQVAVDATTRVAARAITQDIRRAIGGDAADITTQRTSWTDVRLALVLTPVWMLTFVHEGETWNVAVDGRTGAVDGRFPLDKVKVAKALASCFAQLVLASAVVAAAMWAWIKFF